MHAHRSPSPSSYDEYPNLKQVLAPEYATLPPAEIEALMEGIFGPGAAEQYEEYLEGIFGDIGKAFSSAARDVGRFATKAAPAVATVGGGALQGALAGAPLGLPGIIAGAAAGGTGAALSKYGKGAARNIGGALSGVTSLAGQLSPSGRVGSTIGPAISGLAGGGGRGAAGAAVNALGGLLGGSRSSAGTNALGRLLGGGAGSTGAAGTGGGLGALANLFGGSGGATSQLLSLLQRPETLQALAALNLRAIGRKTIPVGAARTPVPATAIARVMGELAEQAIAEAAALSDGAESELRYMMNEAGEFIGDPALDRDRAARVWDLLNEAQAERLINAIRIQEETREQIQERAAEAHYQATYAESEDSEAEYYDALDLAEIYTLPSEDSSELFMEFDLEDLSEDYSDWREGIFYERA